MPEQQSQATVSSLVASSLMAANMPVGKNNSGAQRGLFSPKCTHWPECAARLEGQGWNY